MVQKNQPKSSPGGATSPGGVASFGADQPLIYVDQVGQVNVGPFVSRVSFVSTLGKGGDVSPTSVLQIAIPTAGLFAMANQLVGLFSREQVRELIRLNGEMFSNSLSGKDKNPVASLEKDE